MSPEVIAGHALLGVRVHQLAHQVNAGLAQALDALVENELVHQVKVLLVFVGRILAAPANLDYGLRNLLVRSVAVPVERVTG
jgi:hypothetical protein